MNTGAWKLIMWSLYGLHTIASAIERCTRWAHTQATVRYYMALDQGLADRTYPYRKS